MGKTLMLDADLSMALGAQRTRENDAAQALFDMRDAAWKDPDGFTWRDLPSGKTLFCQVGMNRDYDNVVGYEYQGSPVSDARELVRLIKEG